MVQFLWLGALLIPTTLKRVPAIFYVILAHAFYMVPSLKGSPSTLQGKNLSVESDDNIEKPVERFKAGRGQVWVSQCRVTLKNFQKEHSLLKCDDITKQKSLN